VGKQKGPLVLTERQGGGDGRRGTGSKEGRTCSEQQCVVHNQGWKESEQDGQTLCRGAGRRTLDSPEPTTEGGGPHSPKPEAGHSLGEPLGIRQSTYRHDVGVSRGRQAEKTKGHHSTQRRGGGGTQKPDSRDHRERYKDVAGINAAA
jgi:hypothetical protein